MSLVPVYLLIAYGLAAALVTSIVFATIGAFLSRDDESPASSRWCAALGVGLAYLLGHAIVSEWHRDDRPRQTWIVLKKWARQGGSFPLFPGNAYDWLVWIVAGSTILGVLDGRWPTPRWSRWQNRILLTGLLIWFLLSWNIASDAEPGGTNWTPGQAARWMIGFGVAVFALWTILDLRAERLGPSMPLVLLLPATGLAMAGVLSSSLIFGELAGVLAATTGALWLVSWFHPRMNLARGVIPTFVMVFCGVILSGVYLSSLPKPSAILLAIAPLASFVDRLVVRPRSVSADDEPIVATGGWKVAFVRSVAVLIPVAIAVGIAFAYSPVADSPSQS